MKKLYVTVLTSLIASSSLQSQHFNSGYSFSTRVCNGALFVSGSNSYGQAGNGVTGGISKTPTAVSSLNANVLAISGGGSHCLALKTDGSVWAWGWNNFGQLGDGTTTDSDTPLMISGLSNVSKLSAGSNHNVVVSGGNVYTWGSNGSGQLGNNTTNTSKMPIQVAGLSNVIEVAAGRYHCLALKNDGTLWVWGSNSFGQLGDGGLNASKVPKQIGLTNVIQIVCGEEQSYALKSDGTVWAWGNNNLGQLGNGSNTNSSQPVQVSGLSGVTDISSVLGDHCVAVKGDGTVWAWGYNFYGQLGNNTNTSSNVPVQVQGLSGVTNVEAGGNHCLAMKSDGSIWAWGSNVNGELGDGTSTSRKTPVNVGTLCSYAVVGINENQAFGNVTVYPNPANGRVAIDLEYEASMKLIDQTGRVVLAADLMPGTNTVNLEGLQAGVYIFILTGDKGTSYIKVSKDQ